ncbi:MAG TPA: hypothetical protein DCP92_07495 [Nitrospiraceae bacterium]|jgi:hypothetical protein|nr:hypothetical protein [Nitrospiraceae bacterium]
MGDVIKGAGTATEEVGTGLTRSTKSVAKGIVDSYPDYRIRIKVSWLVSWGSISKREKTAFQAV